MFIEIALKHFSAPVLCASLSDNWLCVGSAAVRFISVLPQESSVYLIRLSRDVNMLSFKMDAEGRLVCLDGTCFGVVAAGTQYLRKLATTGCIARILRTELNT